MHLSAVPTFVRDRLVDLRRSFHRFPELAFEEERTAQRVIEELESLGIPSRYEGLGSGVVGSLKTSDGRPTIALRAEMDGLPGFETTGLEFQSQADGRVHACGHDAHMAMVLGAAHLLVRHPPDLNVLFVFQPAEERGGGSRTVLAEGHLDEASAIFAGHVTHHYHVGEVMVSSGTITAQSDRFVMTITGRGGHGARPHEATDAVVICGLLITALQTLISREVDPIHPSVVTIGRVEAGTAANVIAERAVLEGSIRTTRPDIRDHLLAGLGRMAKAFGELHGASVDVETRAGYPPVVNTDIEASLATRAVTEVLGRGALKSLDHPSMGAEDFSFYLEEMPGCYVRFGARPPGADYLPLHSPSFDIDERVLAIGAAVFDQIARDAVGLYEGTRDDHRVHVFS